MNLRTLCRQYVAVISRIEHCHGCEYWQVQELEEARAALHYNVVRALRQAGYEVYDRYQATELAFQIAGGI